MTSNRPVGTVFREGDEIVLAEGTYQGTLGIFVRLRKDVNWADITERNGSIRSHPVVWLDHSTGAIRGSVDWTPAEPEATRKLEMESQLNSSLDEDVEAWEGEGGTVPGLPNPGAASMGGMASQVKLEDTLSAAP